MDYKIIKVSMENEFKICPSCEYKGGFHSMFIKRGGGNEMFIYMPLLSKCF